MKNKTDEFLLVGGRVKTKEPCPICDKPCDVQREAHANSIYCKSCDLLCEVDKDLESRDEKR